MSWFGQRKKSPKLSNSGVVSSGSVEKPAPGTWLEGDGQGLHNPLAWDNMPSSLQQKFPHWKDTSPRAQGQNPGTQAESYSCYKTTYNTKQQPAYTFPYVVMDNDSLNSIAVKFETTPAELARLNKKPLGATSTIFTGEVLYIPDQDEIARSAPKSAPPHLTLTSSGQFPGSVDSEDTLRSSSVSGPLPDGNQEGGEEGEGEGQESKCEDKAEEEKNGEEAFSPSTSKGHELFEEVADTHIVVVSRYISDDQGCAHGNLMINQTAMMFTPFPDEPLVREHGSASFEIMIPLQDITFAAFTKDINPPESFNSKKALRAALLAAEEKTSEHLSLTTDSSLHTPDRRAVEKEGAEGEEGAQSEVTQSQEARTHDGHGSDGNGDSNHGSDNIHGDESGNGDSEKVNAECLESSSSHKETGSGGESEGTGDPPPPHQTSNEELLAIMGAVCPGEDACRNSTHTGSEYSGDSILSDLPCFLHIKVSQKCSAAHTYTPLNRGVGIDIPHGAVLSPSKSLVQQVKTLFCFAVAEKRTNDLVNFITKYHPGVGMGDRHSPACPTSWSDGVFEFISSADTVSHEDLNFSDNHFMGAESSESWEVYSLKDVSKYRQKIDRMEVEAALPLPKLSEPSSLMEDTHLRALSDSSNILSAAVGHDWYLVYSTFKHGISLRTLYRNMITCELPESAIVLLVRDEQNKLFGAALTVSLRLSDKFYGTGESYLFSFETATDLKIYPWTGENNYFVKGSTDGICIGCGDGHAGLWLDESLLSGSSEECSTFGNNCLSSKAEFICTGVEAWGFF